MLEVLTHEETDRAFTEAVTFDAGKTCNGQQLPDLKALYHELSDGRKRTVRNRYSYLFGTRSSFFRKLNGETRMNRAEQIFFMNALTP